MPVVAGSWRAHRIMNLLRIKNETNWIYLRFFNKIRCALCSGFMETASISAVISDFIIHFKYSVLLPCSSGAHFGYPSAPFAVHLICFYLAASLFPLIETIASFTAAESVVINCIDRFQRSIEYPNETISAGKNVAAVCINEQQPTKAVI